MDFVPFKKIARLSRDMIITEKIDGTNACIYIGEDGEFLTASRTRWITPEVDNYGFSKWAHDNKEDLMNLGSGYHFGEWWGQGIQRGYELTEKRFSLFNVSKWGDTGEYERPKCCYVVPTLYTGLFDTDSINVTIHHLELYGSEAALGYMRPERVVIFHTANGIMFKKTILNDEKGKGEM